MLTRLHVRGYKALRDIETTLEPLTVIVGPNGCGKTSVLEAIAMVRDFAVDGEGAPKLHSFEELRWKGATPSSEIAVDLWALLDRADQDRLRDAAENAHEVVGEREARLSFTHGDRGGGFTPTSTWSSLAAVRRLELDAEALARPSYLREVSPRIDDDGSGLATVLSAVIGEQHESFDRIQAQLREFVPEVERIRIRPAHLSVVEMQDVPVALDDAGKEILAKKRYLREVIGHEILLDFRHAKGVPAKHVSEGTLLLLGLLTVVHTGDVSVLLLDDVDRALHPRAQQQLVGYLRKLGEQGIQVIATSHSPYLVLHLEYEDVRIMTMSEAGGALIGKLTDHPEYQRWHDDMTPSEFWTVFGEEWLTKAKDHG